MSEENEQMLLAWLKKGGRPLEMRIAQEFLVAAAHANRGSTLWWFAIEQSPFFEDSDLERAREIDVVGLFSHRQHSEWVVSVDVESKFKAPPFIVLLPTNHGSNTQADALRFRCASEFARTRLPEDQDRELDDLYQAALFDPSIPLGHSILTKGKDGDADPDDRRDKGWEAVMGAAKAADWYATRRDTSTFKELHLSFPVVVTDGILATAEMDGLDLVVHEVDHARCLLKWPLRSTPATVVDIVTVDAWPRFAIGCARAANAVLAHWERGMSPASK
jgi:hypothetical protein